MKKLLLMAIIMIVCLGVSFTVDAKQKGKKETTEKAKIEQNKKDLTDADQEREIIREYLGQADGKEKKKSKGKRLPPGLKKKLERGWDLPPGWQDKVQRGEVLPDDIYKKAERLPDDIVRQMPRHRDDIDTVILDNKAVKVMKKTREVVDILEY
jgi:hypothetical protein